MTRQSGRPGHPAGIAVAALMGALAVAASPAHATAQTPGSQSRSRTLVGAYVVGDLAVGTIVADSTQAALRRLVAPRDMWIISRAEVAAMPEAGDSPGLIWSLDMLRGVARRFDAAIIIEVGASPRASGRVHLAPLLVLPNAPPMALDQIDAANAGAAANILAEHILTDAPALARRGIDDAAMPRSFLVPPPQPSNAPVFFEFQVERPARLDPSSPHATYPPMLRMQNMPGDVLVQFVVDTAGVPDIDTFKVLKTTHDLFSMAVRNALRDIRFSPAEVGGRKVKQLVQMPFVFDPAKP